MLLKFQSSKLSMIIPSTHWAFPVTPARPGAGDFLQEALLWMHLEAGTVCSVSR